MNHRIYVNELHCYFLADEKQKKNTRISSEQYFNLEILPTEGLRKEFASYIVARGKILALGSIRAELGQYHVVGRFLAEKCPDLESLTGVKEERLIQMLKAWLLQNGYKISKEHYRKELGKVVVGESVVVLYLKKVYAFLMPKEEIPEIEKDKWILDKLDFSVRNNPSHPICSLNFTPIIQEGMRKETKRAILIRLTYSAVGTVACELRAVVRLTKFLEEEARGIESFQELNRNLLEEYLVYLNTEAEGKKSYRTELHHLKTILELIGQIFDYKKLLHLFLMDDIPTRQMKAIYQYYSDAEIWRLNSAIAEIDEQVARLLIIHQMLGNRISETLMLEQDCVEKRAGNWMIRVFQQKTQRTCYKPANDAVRSLIEKAIAYTEERFGKRRYIFVYDKEPDLPMQYERVQYLLMAMIQENNLRDDSGKLFGVGTHIFRHTLGKKLTENHVKDEVIAKLLGHRGTSSVHYYRKMGDEKLADETRKYREEKDDILKNIMKEW